jgi:hypothetical protein
MTFDTDADHVLLCRESSGTWTLERWTCVQGVWLSKVLLTRTPASGHKLGRPIVPFGAEGLGYTLVLDIASYSPTTYTSYLTDARLVRDMAAATGSTITTSTTSTSTSTTEPDTTTTEPDTTTSSEDTTTSTDDTTTTTAGG